MIKALLAARPRTSTLQLCLVLTFAAGAPPVLAQQPDEEQPAQRQQAFEAYVSEDALQVLYARNMDVGDLGRNEIRGGFFINEDRDLIGLADMLVDVGEPNRRPYWSLRAGPRVYGALLTIENQDIFAIALGGELSYYLGRARRTAVSVAAFYAPDIITFGIADNVQDVTFKVETQLTDETRVFVGYRMFEFDLPVDREVDDGVHVGIRHNF